MTKKAISIALTAIMAVTLLLPAKANVVVIREEPLREQWELIRPADVNDAIAILRHILGLPSDIIITPENRRISGREIDVNDAIFILRGVLGLELMAFIFYWEVVDDLFFCLAVCPSREGGDCNCYEGLTRSDFIWCHDSWRCLFFEDFWRCGPPLGQFRIQYVEHVGYPHPSGERWGCWMSVRFRTWQNMQSPDNSA
jgi:hypothetical protein